MEGRAGRADPDLLRDGAGGDARGARDHQQAEDAQPVLMREGGEGGYGLGFLHREQQYKNY